jgi:hypothetical protein
MGAMMSKLNCIHAKRVLRQTLKGNKSILNELTLAQFRGQSEGAAISLDPQSKATFKTNQAVGSFYGKLTVNREEHHCETFEFDDLGQFNSEILKLYPGLGFRHESPFFSDDIKNQAVQWMCFFEEAGITYDIKQSTISELHFYGSYILFYLPDVRPYSINECSGGVYIAIMSADIPVDRYNAYFDVIDDLRSSNVFVGYALPHAATEFTMEGNSWLDGNMIIAEAGGRYFVTDKQFLSLNLYFPESDMGALNTSRLKLPVASINSARK